MNVHYLGNPRGPPSSQDHITNRRRTKEHKKKKGSPLSSRVDPRSYSLAAARPD